MWGRLLAAYLCAIWLAPSLALGAEAQSSASTRPLKIVQRALIYHAQAGCYEAALIVKNRSLRRVALGVGGQLSLLDQRGNLAKSENAGSANILPRGSVLLAEPICPRDALQSARLAVKLDVSTWRKSRRRSPVKILGLKYSYEDVFGSPGWRVTGTVRNRFTTKKSNLRLDSAGFVGARLVCTGFTYVDPVYPRLDATFDIDFDYGEDCPPKLDKVSIYPNLGDEKIFNP